MSATLEPAILQLGYQCVGKYADQEYIDALTRAFVRDGADYVVLDSNPHGQRFIACCAVFAIEKGWLYCDRVDTGDQEELATFRLTNAGKNRLGIIS